jgi:hypothetical protein
MGNQSTFIIRGTQCPFCPLPSSHQQNYETEDNSEIVREQAKETKIVEQAHRLPICFLKKSVEVTPSKCKHQRAAVHCGEGAAMSTRGACAPLRFLL